MLEVHRPENRGKHCKTIGHDNDVVYQKLSISMMSFSEYLHLESECSLTKYAFSWPNVKY